MGNAQVQYFTQFLQTPNNQYISTSHNMDQLPIAIISIVSNFDNPFIDNVGIEEAKYLFMLLQLLVMLLVLQHATK